MTRIKGAYYCEMQYDAFRRKYNKWLEKGDSSFIHGLVGKPSNNKRKINYEKILELRNRPEYIGDNFSDFTFCLNKYEGIKISYTSVYTFLVNQNIKPPLQYRKKRKNVHKRRDPREFEGELVQMDASPYPLLEHFGDKSKYSLHGAVDDATGACVGLYICENECSYGYFEVLRYMWKNFGVPLSDYTDRLKFFNRSRAKLTTEEQLAGEEYHMTQWMNMCRRLSIKHILAHSSQAKGRVERMWRTIKGELPSRIIKFNLDSIDKVNAYLPAFIKEYNQRFASEAKFPDKPVWRKPPVDCEYWLYYHDARQMNHAGEFSYKGLKCQCTEPNPSGRSASICVGISGIYTWRDNKLYKVSILDNGREASESTSQMFQKIISDTLKKPLKEDVEEAA